MATPQPTPTTTRLLASEVQRLSPSITEYPSELTRSLDTATAIGKLRQLRQSDAQMFSGYASFPSICDAEILAQITRGSAVVEECLAESEENVILLCGSGTSGRFAFTVATLLNRATGTKRFRYCNSGGDSALLLPAERAEDDTTRAVKDFKSATKGASGVL